MNQFASVRLQTPCQDVNAEERGPRALASMDFRRRRPLIARAKLESESHMM
jgi:hypothetical protein